MLIKDNRSLLQVIFGTVILGLSAVVYALPRVKNLQAENSLEVLTQKELKSELTKNVSLSVGSDIKGSSLRFAKESLSGQVSMASGEICQVKSRVLRVPPAPGQGTKIKKQVGVRVDCNSTKKR